MAELVRTVNFAETFAALRLGESVEFSVAEFTESSVRANASRYCKGKNIKLSVSANHEPLDRLHLQQIAAAYAAGYRMARAELADDTKYYTLTQCYRKFGRGTVDRWATEGLIEIIKDGTRNSKCRVLAERIELVASQSNRASWFDNHE